ncbi:MAG: hypothetical protein ABL890_01940 [Candidatus Peribacteraceae bacterium]
MRPRHDLSLSYMGDIAEQRGWQSLWIMNAATAAILSTKKYVVRGMSYVV